MKTETLIFTREKSDVNGNPRYSIDVDAILKPGEVLAGNVDTVSKRANSIGGKKMRGCGMFVFQSYSIQATADDIGRVTGRKFKAQQG